MKTSGVSCVPKFRLLFFLGHPNVCRSFTSIACLAGEQLYLTLGQLMPMHGEGAQGSGCNASSQVLFMSIALISLMLPPNQADNATDPHGRSAGNPPRLSQQKSTI